MADPNKFPWRVQDDDALAALYGIDVRSGWAEIQDADGLTIGAVYMLSRAENLEWAQKIVDLVNEAYARPSDV